MNGEGVLRDYAEAARWYRLAAEQGLAEAQDALEAALAGVAVEQGSADLQFFLGLTRWRGEGPNGEVALKDPEEAVRWFRMAAEQGHAEAQYSLGVAYDTGEGVPEDDAEAVRWYRMAAEAEQCQRAVKPWDHVLHRRGRPGG